MRLAPVEKMDEARDEPWVDDATDMRGVWFGAFNVD
jgi:hypothetical protein